MTTANKFQTDSMTKLKSKSDNKPSKLNPIREAIASPEVKPIYEVQYNIDTIELSVTDERNTFKIPSTITAHLINDDDGVHLDSYQNRVPITGKFGAHNLQVRTMNSGEKLVAEGSPYAFEFSQNTFTNQYMKRAAIIALKNACKKIGYKPTAEQMKRWKAGNIDLDRVDIAVNFRLKCEEEVVGILQQIKRQLVEQDCSMKVVGSTTYQTPGGGKHHSYGFYAKGPQLRRSKRYNQLPDKDKYMEECKSILRVEIRLRTHALAELGLSKVSDWTDDSAKKAFNKYMRKLKFLNITSGPLTADEIESLPSRLCHVLALHKAGYDLNALYLPRTLQRHQSDFRKLGIDLRVPNQTANTVVSLTKILSPKNAIKATPAWLIDSGMAPPPNKIR